MKVIGIEEGREKIKKINKKKLTVLIIISVLILTAIILFCVYMGNKTFRDFMDKYVLMKNVTENNLNSITLEEPENIQVYAYDKYISVDTDIILERV